MEDEVNRKYGLFPCTPIIKVLGDRPFFTEETNPAIVSLLKVLLAPTEAMKIMQTFFARESSVYMKGRKVGNNG
ncbi:hypothetical protein ACQCVP_08180 [Rossellomorea vietnamensis]|uniref:hypothetical protein n=1 Tax=Rossellomorea vietnamensis TaxID=218284 RepID=UPI003CEFE73C